jgi:hypothetical protein
VNRQGGILALVVPWSSVEEGDSVLLGSPAEWKLVTAVEPAPEIPGRYIRTVEGVDRWREYSVLDSGLATVMLDSGNQDQKEKLYA